MKIEDNILNGLFQDDSYARKVMPHLTTEYFHDKEYSVVLEEIAKFFSKYNKIPTREIVQLELESRQDILEQELKKAIEVLGFRNNEPVDTEYLVDKTEKFCKDKAVYNAIIRSIKIMDGDDKKLAPDAIPSILSEALAVGFDSKLGHDYLENWEERYEYYHRQDLKIPFHLSLLNKITGGGLSPKTLMAIMAGTGVGKSLLMADMAANNLLIGKNVIYFTLEMSEEKISERIDANLFGVDIRDIKNLEKQEYEAKITSVKRKATGRLVVKEYPTSSAHVGHLRAFVQELKTKRNFVPDIIYVDYINIMSCQRFKMSGDNSYGRIKAIAEEVRGLAVELDIPIVTATQPDRSGQGGASDLDLVNTSESIGFTHSLDFFIALLQPEELQKSGQVHIKQLKNRYGDINYYKRFAVGVNKSKMCFYDLEDSAQKGITDGPDENLSKSNTRGLDVIPTGKPLKLADFSEFKF